jgi:hypothetical protein
MKTNGHCDYYIALSHCWGDTIHRPLQTTSSSLEAHLASIPLEQLPRTFQDAVAIASRLLHKQGYLKGLEALLVKASKAQGKAHVASY